MFLPKEVVRDITQDGGMDLGKIIGIDTVPDGPRFRSILWQRIFLELGNEKAKRFFVSTYAPFPRAGMVGDLELMSFPSRLSVWHDIPVQKWTTGIMPQPAKDRLLEGVLGLWRRNPAIEERVAGAEVQDPGFRLVRFPLDLVTNKVSGVWFVSRRDGFSWARWDGVGAFRANEEEGRGSGEVKNFPAPAVGIQPSRLLRAGDEILAVRWPKIASVMESPNKKRDQIRLSIKERWEIPHRDMPGFEEEDAAWRMKNQPPHPSERREFQDVAFSRYFRYYRPSGLAMASDGRLWFCEVASVGYFYESSVGEQLGAHALLPHAIGWLDRASGQVWRKELEGPDAFGFPGGLCEGPDGAMWFTLRKSNRIGRITVDGKVTTFDLPTAEADPRCIVKGPDGAMWFTEYEANKIGRITMDGKITEFDIPTPNSWPCQMVAGADGNLWFVEAWPAKVGRITPQGRIDEIPIPCGGEPYGVSAPSDGHGMVLGADGDIYFAMEGAQRLARIKVALANQMIQAGDFAAIRGRGLLLPEVPKDKAVQ